MMYKHNNGYSARLYGKSSMSIYNQQGREVMHTGSRSVNKEDEVMELLGNYPDFITILQKAFNDDTISDDCDI